jgi:predicted RNase H-like HicB family nuclease
MTFDDYKVVVYRNQPDGWVAEIPALGGCYALMDTPELAIAELRNEFDMIEEEHVEKGISLPLDTTEITHA